ncbi:MAG: thioredoxin family protein, partial [Bacteroidota bacterium]
EGLAYAKSVNKPILLDFTGWACVNCRRMEENVWVNPEVYKRLSEDYVLISLYVDDRKKLPKEEQIEVMTISGPKKIRTVGNKWETLQIETFNINAQPYYALISPDEQLLNTPVAYTPDADIYRDFLDCGLQVHKKKLSVQP